VLSRNESLSDARHLFFCGCQNDFSFLTSGCVVPAIIHLLAPLVGTSIFFSVEVLIFMLYLIEFLKYCSFTCRYILVALIREKMIINIFRDSCTLLSYVQREA
jgi:hypothetical protein